MGAFYGWCFVPVILLVYGIVCMTRSGWVWFRLGGCVWMTFGFRMEMLGLCMCVFWRLWWVCGFRFVYGGVGLAILVGLI